MSCVRNRRPSFSTASSKPDHFRAGPGTLLEGVDVRCPLDLAGRNIVTGLPAGVTKAVALPEGVCLLMLPIRPGDGWAAILYGIDDDFGQPSSSGLSTFLHTPLEDFLREHHLMTGLRWPQEPASVYHAKWWPIASAEEALDLVRWMIPPLAPVLRGEGSGVRGEEASDPSPPTPLPGVPGRGETDASPNGGSVNASRSPN